jgi:hypothetical protein
VRRAHNLTMCRLSRYCGSLNLMEPSGPVQSCTGTALPLLFINTFTTASQPISLRFVVTLFCLPQAVSAFRYLPHACHMPSKNSSLLRLSCKWKQQDHLKRYYLYTNSHGTIPQQTVSPSAPLWEPHKFVIILSLLTNACCDIA